MERLTFTDLKTSNKILKTVEEVLLGILLSFSTIFVLKDLFTLNLSKEIGSFSGGLIGFWNQIAESLGKSDFLILSRFAGGTEGNALFYIVLGVILAAIGYVIIKNKASWALWIFIIPFIGINLVFNLSIGLASASLFVTAIIIIYFYIKHKGAGLFYTIIPVLLMGVLVYSLFNLPVGESFFKGPKSIKELRAKAETQIEKTYYGENSLGSGALNERKREVGDKPALEIKMEEPHSMYLRGFVGEIYNGEKWEQLSNDEHFSNEDLTYRFKESGFNPLGQLNQAALVSKGEDYKSAEGKEITVKALNVDKRYMYLPYEVMKLDENLDVKSGAYVKPEGKRKKEYTFTAGENQVKTWTDTAARIFSDSEKGNSAGEDLDLYLIDESNYNNMVYNAYTYLPTDDKLMLKKYFSHPGDQSKGHIEYKKAIKEIKSYLKDNFIYTNNLGDASKEKISPMEEFFKNKKGYDVQYASAATMMFRYFGIPARYVEGYIVTPEDIKNVEENESFTIPESRIHAWTEIYVDGTGFVPIEVSPEYEGIMEEADMTVGISNNSLLREFEPPQFDKIDNPEDDFGGEGKSHENLKWLILLAIPLSLVIFALIYFIGKLLKNILSDRKRRNFFYKGNPKEAVSAIYGYMEEKLYPINEEAVALGNKAAYSREEISEEERGKMLSFLEEGKKLKKGSSSEENK